MKRKVSRRKFVKWALGTGAALWLPATMGCGGGATGGGSSRREAPVPAGTCLNGGSSSDSPPAVLFIAIDSFPPAYLYLDESGERLAGGAAPLTPNLHAFLAGSTWFEHTRCYLPSATDMNHLNALAGTSSAQHGILGVSAQIHNFGPDGRPVTVRPSYWRARDGNGRALDTVFTAFKRRWPCCRTAFISGKGWVAEMYRSPTAEVDLVVHGLSRPGYVPAPAARSFYDPPNDPDRLTDPESAMQKAFAEQVLMADPEHFPPDSWLADAALSVLAAEKPDLAVILLAQLDDVQHALGAAGDPDEFQPCPGPLCDRRSDRNLFIYREPILDAVRDVDEQFGRLIEGIRAIDRYREATIVLYSDHGHINYLLDRSWRPGDLFPESTDAVAVLRDAGELTDAEAAWNGFGAVAGCSLGILHWKADSMEERRRRAENAKDVLVRHAALNPQTQEMEVPWDVLTHADMQSGVPGVTEPGEIWHDFFGPRNDPDLQTWPDLFLFMRNGWQIPIYGDVVGNLGFELGRELPPVTVFLGGHGAPDSQGILFALSGPGIATGRVVSDPTYARNYRIADAAVTVASMFDLGLRHQTVGVDRTAEARV